MKLLETTVFLAALVKMTEAGYQPVSSQPYFVLLALGWLMTVRSVAEIVTGFWLGALPEDVMLVQSRREWGCSNSHLQQTQRTGENFKRRRFGVFQPRSRQA